jgi:L-ribulose-5-phosphate 3-epimerase
MLLHAGVQTLTELRYLKACPLSDEQALDIYLQRYSIHRKVSAIGLNLIEALGLYERSAHSLHAEFFESAVHIVKLAALLEVPVVYIPSFNENEIVQANDFAMTVTFFRRLCLTTRDLPVMIASENSLSARQQLALVEQVGERNFRILLDTFNPLRWGHSVEEIVAAVHPYLLDQVHVKDGILPGYGNALLGEGNGNVSHIIGAIERLGFCDAYILENNYSLLSLAGLKMDMAFLRMCLSAM